MTNYTRDADYSLNGTLARHEFNCIVCGAAFKSEWAVAAHVELHENEQRNALQATRDQFIAAALSALITHRVPVDRISADVEKAIVKQAVRFANLIMQERGGSNDQS